MKLKDQYHVEYRPRDREYRVYRIYSKSGIAIKPVCSVVKAQNVLILLDKMQKYINVSQPIEYNKRNIIDLIARDFYYRNQTHIKIRGNECHMSKYGDMIQGGQNRKDYDHQFHLPLLVLQKLRIVKFNDETITYYPQLGKKLVVKLSKQLLLTI